MESICMVHPDGTDELKGKHICYGCVGESYLSAEIDRTGEEAVCDYCGETERSWTIAALAASIEKAFADHYVRTPDQPNGWEMSLLRDRELNYEWEREGFPVLDAVETAACIPSPAAADVLAILDDTHVDFDFDGIGEETEFSRASHYEEKSPSSAEWHQEWRWFEHSLKTEARFFSKAAAAHLASVFGGIDKIRTRKGRNLAIYAGPTRAINHLYRARVFQSDEKLEEALCRPDIHLCSPPSRLASAGRMNARGISVFYGATSAKAAMAEVRPPVGSRVAVAKFEILRPLYLLDLTALEMAIDGGSIFDPSLKARLERVAFLRSLGERMTRPVMPEDEALDYLATQAVADFLATENDPVLDGIIYRSVQVKGGRNVVLFHNSARVAALDFPKDSEIRAHSYSDTEDGPELDYQVWETVPPPATLASTEDAYFMFAPLLSNQPDSVEWDGRENSLSVDTKSVQVHWIEWVSFRSTCHSVVRHRVEKRGGPDDF